MNRRQYKKDYKKRNGINPPHYFKPYRYMRYEDLPFKVRFRMAVNNMSKSIRGIGFMFKDMSKKFAELNQIKRRLNNE